MTGLKSMVVIFIVMMVASSTLAQTQHIVLDTLGWTIPSNGEAAYTLWATGKTFTVGDSLVFNFQTGAHNVEEVSEAAYGACTTTSPMLQTTSGPANITLTTPGNHYYVCGVGTHCSLGQKLTINVVAASPSSPTAPTTPAPPAGSTPTPPSPPSPSSASSFAVVVPVTFLAAALAIFY